MNLLETIKALLGLTLPFITNLIKSKVVPTLKRKAYEAVDNKVNKLIKDLAQNASKIKDADDSIKYQAYTEGTKLGIETIRAIAQKLSVAADEIEKVL